MGPGLFRHGLKDAAHVRIPRERDSVWGFLRERHLSGEKDGQKTRRFR